MKNCCGQKRNQWNQATVLQAPLPVTITVPQPDTIITKPVLAKYTGSSYLIIKGSRSGRKYYFTTAQPVLEIDSNDAGALMAHPQLIRV